MYFIGIDNGTTGSIAIIDENLKIHHFGAIPFKRTINYTKKGKVISRIDFEKLNSLLSQFQNDSFCITEYPAINPKFVNTSILAARAFEALLIVLEFNKIPYEIIPSKTWQKLLLPKMKNSKDLKLAADEKAKQIFGINDIPKGFGDSLLLAYYLRLKFIPTNLKKN